MTPTCPECHSTNITHSDPCRDCGHDANRETAIQVAARVKSHLDAHPEVDEPIIDRESLLLLVNSVQAASRLHGDMRAMIAESNGVAGLHQNGDVAPWHELLTGGRFEEWLLSLDDLHSALAALSAP